MQSKGYSREKKAVISEKTAVRKNEKKTGLLKKQIAEYNEKICFIKDFLIKKVWTPFDPLIPYTVHDERHSEIIEEMLGNLLPENVYDHLTPREYFLLIASIWLHDVGMVPHLFDNEKVAPDVIVDDDRQIKRNRENRKIHEERSCRYIKINQDLLGLDRGEASDLITIVKHHRHNAYTKLYQLAPTSTFDPGTRIKLLIAYLRFADALALPLPPKEPAEFRIYLAYGLDPDSLYHWFKSKYTEKIEFDHKTGKVTIKIQRPQSGTAEEWHKKTEPLKRALKTSLQDELDSVRDIIVSNGGPRFYEVECECYGESQMEEKEQQNLEILLNNIELFDEYLTPNSSLLKEKILKQVLVLIEGTDAEAGIVYLRNYLKSVAEDLLEKKRFHINIIKIKEDLTKILRRKISDPDKIQEIKAYIKKLESQQGSITLQIAKNFHKHIQKTRKNHHNRPLSFLIYAYSDTVVKCLAYFNDQEQKPMNIYVCEGRPKTNYRFNNRLDYSDGIKYSDEITNQVKNRVPGFSIKIIPDISASYLFANKEVDYILFGANGIGHSGTVTHSLGHLGIADMAYSSYKVPVIILAESNKIDARVDVKDKKRENRNPHWLTTDILFESRIKGKTEFNPRGDFIPPEKISRIITEKEILRPGEIQSTIDKF